MEKSMKRAIRRHHISRLKQTRKSFFALDWWADIDKRLGIISQYPKKCSCVMCGNPRKWFNDRTIAELRDMDRMADGLTEVFSEK